MIIIPITKKDSVYFILDEWKAGQDPQFRRILYFEITPKLKAMGKTLIVISHDGHYFEQARGQIAINKKWITIRIGNPTLIGITDINKPDFGDASRIEQDEVPVFWACGVTPKNIAITSKPELMITHAPSYMFICNPKDEDLAVL